MKTTEHGIESSRDVENVYHMRLMALLQELVREKGYKGAARVLEIDPQTVTESAKTGQLTRRVRQALERALQEGVGSAAERQRRRNEELEGRLRAVEEGHDELGKEVRRRLSGIEREVRPCVGTDPRGPGPVRPAPVHPRMVQPRPKPVHQAGTENLRRSPRCGGSTPTLRRWSRTTTTRRYSATRGR